MAEFAEVMNHARRMCSVTACWACGLYAGEMHCKLKNAPIVYDEDTLKEMEEVVMNWARKNPYPRYPSYYEHTTKILPTLNPNFFFSRCLCDLYGEEARPPRCDGAGNHEISCKACWARVMSAKIAKEVGAEKKQYLEDT